jgi:periplasmic divalent cation tolerance protein
MRRWSGRKRASRNALVVFVTAANKRQALKIGKVAIDSRLAACVNVIPSIQSVYRWKGKVIVGEEALVIVKTTDERYPALEKLIMAAHSYEVPEIIALPIKRGSKQYLGWVLSEIYN